MHVCVRRNATHTPDGFIHDVSVGDELLVDGGIISFVVRGKTDTDVQVRGVVCRGGRVVRAMWRREAIERGSTTQQRHMHSHACSCKVWC
jgi:hypothetical protein